eukprot:m.177383 g.177383  ORF g.177383 m.177383 type:complete len:597 (-) comp17379_c3_seq4:437-2227(-)
MSLLGQWRDEVAIHAPGLRVIVYYGGGRDRDNLNALCNTDVVLTTYGTVTAEFNSEKGLLFGISFWRVVLDEAHVIKNRTAAVSQACCRIRAQRRWALSGTPIQNHLDDVFSLLRFLGIQPWGVFSYWKEHIQRAFDRDEASALEVLRNILQPLLLRRTKDSLDKNGLPILTLPPSHVSIVRLQMSEQEQTFYEALQTRSKSRFTEFQAAGTVMRNYANILELLLRLRQACDHPFLTYKATDEAGPSSKTKAVAAHTFSDIDRLISHFLATSGDSSGVTQAYAASVVEMLKQIDARASESDGANASASTPTAATEAGAAGSAGTQASSAECLECPICLERPDIPMLTPCGHLGCQECFEAVVSSLGKCPVCQKATDLSELVQLRRGSASASANEAESDAACARMSAPARALTLVLQEHYVPSTKISALVAEIQAMVQADSTDKCVVFSQWTAMLDLVEIAFAKTGINYVRLDGSMSQAQRVRVLDDFKKDPSIHVFLISLRSGGVGLNLTAASRVVLLDPWWNPAVEEQAIDRVHRIGQEKDVYVKRFITADTVEERIIELQAKKKHLAQNALHKTESGEEGDMRMSDLKLLFGLK